MLICPHCNQEGIMLKKKLYTGPLRTITCKKCGKEVGVPWGKSTIALLPLFLLNAILEYYLKVDFYIYAPLMILMLLLTLYLYISWVPLVKKE